MGMNAGLEILEAGGRAGLVRGGGGKAGEGDKTQRKAPHPPWMQSSLSRKVRMIGIENIVLTNYTPPQIDF